jgi:DNA-binding NarL/FixJ family response regulator
MRVFIVDDHPLFRRGLKRVLEDNGHTVVGEAGDGEEALRCIRPGLADAVFMDLQMPGLDGVAATRALAGVVPVIALTVSEDDADLARAVDAGASGYLVKRAEPAQILQALKAVCSGQCVLAPELTGKAFSVLKRHAADELSYLSKRQRQVLAGIADGLSLREISGQLGISIHTVKTYMERLSEKLGAGSHAKLRVIAIRLCSRADAPRAKFVNGA